MASTTVATTATGGGTGGFKMDFSPLFSTLNTRRGLLLDDSAALEQEDNASSPDIGWQGMLVSCIPILLVAILGTALKLGNVRTLLIASSRCVLQLLLLGVILTPIFLNNQPYVVLPYVYVVMVGFATREASVKPKHSYRGMTIHFLLAITTSLTCSLALIILGVIQPNPLLTAQVLIPIGGMMLGSCVNALSLGMDRFLSTLRGSGGGSAGLQTLLACGATKWEASLPSIREGIETGLTPTSNQMSVMGLVSIPGMLTGQILAGTPPWIAAKYQIVIMFFLCANSTFILFLSMLQAVFQQLFQGDKQQPNSKKQFYFRGDLVKKRRGAGKPKDIVLATLSQLVQGLQWIRRQFCQNDAVADSAKTDDSDGDIKKMDGSTVELVDHGNTKEFGKNNQASNNDENSSNANTFCRLPVVSPMKKSTNDQPLVSLQDGQLSYDGKRLLDHVNLDLYAGEIVILSGASGTGKSTCLRAMALLQPLDAGTLLYKGQELAPCQWRSEVLYVRQDGGQGLEGTPMDNVRSLCALKAQAQRLATKKMDVSAVEQNFFENLEALALDVAMATKRWDNMSGGEAQRVYLCMMLSLFPSVILLDEPTSACDTANAQRVERLIAATSGLAVIWISHDPAQLERLQALEQTSLVCIVPPPSLSSSEVLVAVEVGSNDDLIDIAKTDDGDEKGAGLSLKMEEEA